MNWAARQRQQWITETLNVFGFINSAHISRMFGIAKSKAAQDIVRWRIDHPDTTAYNENYKCYMLTDGIPKGIVRLRITRPSKRGPNRH